MERVMAKKAKAKVKRKVKAKVNKKQEPLIPNPRPVHHHFWSSKTQFNILPSHLFHPVIYSHLTQIPTNLRERHIYLEKEFPLRDPAPHIPVIEEISWFNWSKLKSTTIRKAISFILKKRFLYKKLVHHWRVKKLVAYNVDDIFTLEPPKKPISVVDWQSKKKYVFEAQTLMRDITCRLMNTDGIFENPQYPRNPFTNISFTQAQMISIWNSIFSYNMYVSSAFTLFRKARYCLHRFELENSNILKLNALSITMKTPSCYDYRDRMLDFISYAYADSCDSCNLNAFKYAMTNYPNNSLLKEWATLCYKYYESEILYINVPAVLATRKTSILNKTHTLIDKENILLRRCPTPSVQDEVENIFNVLIIEALE
jgi:hypothetical protein